MSNKVKNFEFKAEMKQLLKLIVHSLYTHPEVFLRELISNSSDALNKVRFLSITNNEIANPEEELKIKITLDKDNQTFSIEDTGIGMSYEDLRNQLGTVASSGTLKFLDTIKDEKSGEFDGHLIGQFGVGFYSVFMVTDQVTVETKYALDDSPAYRWTSNGEESFTIEEISKDVRGTKITFKLKDEYKEFVEEYRIKNVINRYSNFVDFPLYIGENRENTVQAIWHRKKDDVKPEELNEFYKFISNDFQDPLGHIQLAIEGNINFKALIFIPQTAPPQLFNEDYDKSLHLYSSKIFIQDDAKGLIPDYMKFLKGVVDTEDLPLNVSREVTQSSPYMAKIKNIITSKILGLLEDWAENDQEKFNIFISQFGPIFKTGINQDFSNKDRIVDLLRFESTITEPGKITSFKEYKSRMRDDQKEIYYISGSHKDSLIKNPNLEYFKKKEIEVLLLTDPVDVFTIPYLQEYDGTPIKSIDKADVNIEEDSVDDKLLGEDASAVVTLFKDILGDKVEDVRISNRLVDSPVTLVVGEQGLDIQIEKMMLMMDKDFAGSKKIMEINLGHQIIKNISKIIKNEPESVKVKKIVLQLYDSTMLLEGYLKDPNEFVIRMNDLIIEATK